MYLYDLEYKYPSENSTHANTQCSNQLPLRIFSTISQNKEKQKMLFMGKMFPLLISLDFMPFQI